MTKYSYNLLRNDVIQIQFTLSTKEYEDIMENVDKLIKEKEEEFRFDLEETNFILNTETAIKIIMLDDIAEICQGLNIILVEHLVPQVEIKEKKDNVIIIFSCIILDNEYKLIWPDIEDDSPTIKDDEIQTIIDDILINHNYFEYEDVNQIEDDCIIYIDFYGKEIRIDDINPMYVYSSSSLRLKIGGYLEFTNTKMNNRKEYFKIVRIKRKKALELNDEIVKEINFLDAKSVEEFQNKFKKVFLNTERFTRLYLHAKERMIDINNIKISNEAYDIFVKNNVPKKNKNISVEQKYDLIKSFIIDAYLDEMYYNIKDKLDLSYLNDYFMQEYELIRLVNENLDIDYDFYLKSRMYDGFIYTLFKNGGKVNDK